MRIIPWVAAVIALVIGAFLVFVPPRSPRYDQDALTYFGVALLLVSTEIIRAISAHRQLALPPDETLPPVLSAPVARCSWANAIMSMASGTDRTRELRQILIDGLDVVEQSGEDEERLIAALRGFDQAVPS